MKTTAAEMQRQPNAVTHQESETRIDMLKQYARAIDEAFVSFRKARQLNPHDQQLADAFSRFQRGLEFQVHRLEAIQHRLTDESELLVFDRTIQSIKQAAQSTESTEMAMCTY